MANVYVFVQVSETVCHFVMKVEVSEGVRWSGGEGVCARGQDSTMY